jgi:hypothetical protein
MSGPRPVRQPGDTIKTTQGPMISGVLIAHAAIPMPEGSPKPANHGFAIVLLEDGAVSLCATGALWTDVFARTATFYGVTPEAAFYQLRANISLINQFEKLGLWDTGEISKALNFTWTEMRQT